MEVPTHAISPFNRKGAFLTKGFRGTCADFMPEYKQYINDGKIIIAAPHKFYGPEAADLNLQLCKASGYKIILCGMSANP